jgi:hypothetical protein
MIAIRKLIREAVLRTQLSFVSDKNTIKVKPDLVSVLKKDINRNDDTSNYAPSWKLMIEEFKRAISNDNLNNFLRWDIVQRTITSANSTLVDKEYNALKKDKYFNSFWVPLLLEGSLGNPELYWRNIKFGVNKIHQAYHLMLFRNYSNEDIQSLGLVVEFGGGYGNMCELFHRINKQQKYFIFDFPEMLALQKFYINSLNIHADFEYKEDNYCTLYSDLSKMESQVKNVSGKKLFIATWSFSESPVALRELFTNMLFGFDCFIIAFQDEFDQIRNIDYFKNWMAQFDQISWQLNEIPHFKDSYYLLGKRK